MYGTTEMSISLSPTFLTIFSDKTRRTNDARFPVETYFLLSGSVETESVSFSSPTTLPNHKLSQSFHCVPKPNRFPSTPVGAEIAFFHALFSPETLTTTFAAFVSLQYRSNEGLSLIVPR